MELTSHPYSRSGWRWLAISVALVTVAQLALKYAMQQLPTGHGFEVFVVMLRPANIVGVDLLIISGIGCYVLSVLCWIGTLSRLPLSMAYPALALSYLTVYAGAILLPWFHETADMTRMLGILLVIFGVWLVSLPGREGAAPTL